MAVWNADMFNIQAIILKIQEESFSDKRQSAVILHSTFYFDSVFIIAIKPNTFYYKCFKSTNTTYNCLCARLRLNVRCNFLQLCDDKGTWKRAWRCEWHERWAVRDARVSQTLKLQQHLKALPKKKKRIKNQVEPMSVIPGPKQLERRKICHHEVLSPFAKIIRTFVDIRQSQNQAIFDLRGVQEQCFEALHQVQTVDWWVLWGVVHPNGTPETATAAAVPTAHITLLKMGPHDYPEPFIENNAVSVSAGWLSASSVTVHLCSAAPRHLLKWLLVEEHFPKDVVDLVVLEHFPARLTTQKHHCTHSHWFRAPLKELIWTSSGYRFVLVLVDYTTRYLESRIYILVQTWMQLLCSQMHKQTTAKRKLHQGLTQMDWKLHMWKHPKGVLK